MSKDWTEDATHENGKYMCQCSQCDSTFIGHKRRTVCKECSSTALPQVGETKPINNLDIWEAAKKAGLLPNSVYMWELPLQRFVAEILRIAAPAGLGEAKVEKVEAHMKSKPLTLSPLMKELCDREDQLDGPLPPLSQPRKPVYRPGVTLEQMLRDGWSRDFKPEQTIEECAASGHAVSMKFVKLVWAAMSAEMNDAMNAEVEADRQKGEAKAVAYIDRKDLAALQACQHMRAELRVGLDSPSVWPAGEGESDPPDSLVPLYLGEAKQPTDEQILEHALEAFGRHKEFSNCFDCVSEYGIVAFVRSCLATPAKPSDEEELL